MCLYIYEIEGLQKQRILFIAVVISLSIYVHAVSIRAIEMTPNTKNGSKECQKKYTSIIIHSILCTALAALFI